MSPSQGSRKINAALLEQYAIRFSWDAKKLEKTLVACGPISEDGHWKLLHELDYGFARFQSLGPNVRTIPAGETAKRIRAVESSSRKLLKTIGFRVGRIDWSLIDNRYPDRSAQWHLDVLYNLQQNGEATADNGRGVLLPLANARIVAKALDTSADLVDVNRSLNSAAEKISEAALGILFLYRQSEEARKRIDERGRIGAGGAANRQTQPGLLIRDAINLYESVRRAHLPKDRMRVTGLGGPLRRFVHAVADLFGTEISDQQIDEGWRASLRRNQKTE